MPLNDSDCTGAGLAIADLPPPIGRPALMYALQSWFDNLQGNFGLNLLTAGLAVALTAAPINGFVSLISPGGTAIGAVLTMIIGTPIVSLQEAKEFPAGA